MVRTGIALLALAGAVASPAQARWSAPVTATPLSAAGRGGKVVFTATGRVQALFERQVPSNQIDSFTTTSGRQLVGRGEVFADLSQTLMLAPFGRDSAVAVDTPGSKLLAAVGAPGGTFAAAQELTASGYPNVLAVTRAGEAIVAWQTLCTRECTPKNTLQVAVLPAGGSAFGAPAQLSSPTLNAGGARAVTDASGNLMVAWISSAADEDANESSSRLHYAIKPAGRPFGPEQEAASTTGVSGFRMSSNAAGDVAVVMDRFGRRSGLVASGNVAYGLTPARRLGRGYVRDVRVRLAGGHGAVAWIEQSGKRTRVRLATLDRSEIRGARTVAHGPAYHLRLAVDSHGRRALAWQEFVYREGALEAAVTTAHGLRRERVASRDANYVDLRWTSRGVALMAWQKTDGYRSEVEATAAARHGFGPVSQLSSRAMSVGIPRLETGPAGRALVYWGQSQRRGDGSNAAIAYYTR